MYETILIPTDGSDAAENAVEHALDIAGTYGAEIHALYVVDTDAMDISLGTEQVDRLRAGHFDEMDDLEANARKATGRVAERADERTIPITEQIAAGQPHREITDYAEENGIDLIVMGSHGRSGVKRLLLGSVTERVLRTTRIPVLAVDIQESSASA